MARIGRPTYLDKINAEIRRVKKRNQARKKAEAKPKPKKKACANCVGGLVRAKPKAVKGGVGGLVKAKPKAKPKANGSKSIKSKKGKK